MDFVTPVTRLRQEITVNKEAKTLAVIISLLDNLCGWEARKTIIRTLAFYFKVDQ
jgi:hypothetical protein